MNPAELIPIFCGSILVGALIGKALAAWILTWREKP